LILSRTPYRISFFGGGTDYHSWYQNHGGAVLSTTINRYAYITARNLPPFHKEKSRIVWSKIEAVGDNKDIEHPAVRSCLHYLGIADGVEIHHTGDLPARSGLGSSSAFTVGLLNCLRTLQRKPPTKKDLAIEAVHIERDVMKENVGIQDQIACAYGGLNRVNIENNGSFNVLPVRTTLYWKRELQKHLMLFFTGVSRTASDIAIEQIKAHGTGSKDTELHAMRALVDEAERIITKSRGDITEFGRLMHESWLIKRSLAKNITSDFIDDVYNKAKDMGAIGGKLLGAGGGGFMLLFAEPEKHYFIRKALGSLLWVPFGFEESGSQIILNSRA